jgi:signal peptidase I
VTSYFSPALFVLTVLTGAIWLLELFYLGPRRAKTGVMAANDGAMPQDRVAGEQSSGPDRELNEADAAQPAWIEMTAGFFPVLALVFVMRSFLFEPFTIPSGSMTPTLLVGDYILVNKFTYGIRLPILNKKVLQVHDPKPGDIMVFRHPNDTATDLVKRVIGVPGDRIDYHGKRLTIDGHALDYRAQADYLGDESLTMSKRYLENLNGVQHDVLETEGQPPLLAVPDDFPGRENCSYDRDGFACTVPQGQYFMMGDNRDNSSDSRYWGFVPDANIVGKAVFVWMNFHDVGRIGTKLD